MIDPAVSYGNREFDIAMTTLFGGLDDSFYQAYNDESITTGLAATPATLEPLSVAGAC